MSKVRQQANLDPAATMEPIGSIRPHPRNPRKNDDAVPRVAASIERFGFAAPIVCQRSTRTILAGHTRHKAALSLGMQEVPVRFVDLSDDDALAYVLADNRLGEIADWDEEALAEDLRLLTAVDMDPLLLGFDEREVERLLRLPDEELVEDDAPEPTTGPADSQPGQVYELGPHRLWCGDNIDPDIRAVASAGVGAVVTDPPYGINYGAKGFGGNGWVTRAATTWDANRPPPESFAWMLSVSSVVVLWGGNYFTDLVPPTMGWLVWDKGQREFSLADCEMAWTSRQKAARVITYSRGAAVKDGKEHPTQKPIAVMVWTIERTCEDIATVLDPYAGSGTTLIACAETGRVARCIELDPTYCDVIRRRWTRYAKERGLDPGTGALDG